MTASCQTAPAEAETPQTETASAPATNQQILHLTTTDTLPYPIVDNFDDLSQEANACSTVSKSST